jgi:hypothetical protein
MQTLFGMTGSTLMRQGHLPNVTVGVRDLDHHEITILAQAAGCGVLHVHLGYGEDGQGDGVPRIMYRGTALQRHTSRCVVLLQDSTHFVLLVKKMLYQGVTVIMTGMDECGPDREETWHSGCTTSLAGATALDERTMVANLSIDGVTAEYFERTTSLDDTGHIRHGVGLC